MLNLASTFQPINGTKAPEKKIPSTAAKAIKRSANESDSIHCKESAFFLYSWKNFQRIK
jgi:hypothetical protein